MKVCCPHSYQIVTNEPYLTIPLDEVKDYLNIPIEDTSEDQIITDMILSAQCAFESYTRVELTEKTFNLLESCWCRCFEIIRVPVREITNVKYFDTNGDQQTVNSAEYYLTPLTPYPLLEFEDTYSFPSLRNRFLQIEIQFIAGLTSTLEPDAPACLRSALMAHVSYLYFNRDCACDSSSIPAQSKTAYNKYKIWSI